MRKLYFVYISLSGNTESFVRRLKNFLELQKEWTIELLHIKDLVKQNIPFYSLDAPCVAFLPTYLEGGNGVDNGDREILTNPVREFIDFGENARLCLGVVGSGNRNFNLQYCLTAKQYAEQFDFPVIDTFELRGMTNDVERIGLKIISLMERE